LALLLVLLRKPRQLLIVLKKAVVGVFLVMLTLGLVSSGKVAAANVPA
jgi:hypothetical protein